MKCVLCNGEIEVTSYGWSEGHNAQPLAEGRCCDKCNGHVLAARIRAIRIRKVV